MRAKHALWLWLIGTTLLFISSLDAFHFQQTSIRLVGLCLEWLGVVVLVIKVLRYPGIKDFLNS